MSHTILVTGAAGTVGTEVVKSLINRGVTVRAGVHSIIKGDRLKRLNPTLQMVEIDYSKPETLRVALTGVERLFLLTPATADQVTIGKHLIDAAKEIGIKQIVKLSAAEAAAEAPIEIGRMHREVEQYLQQSGVPAVLLRPTNYMQNFATRNYETIRDEGRLPLPLSDGKVAFIDVRDIADAAATILCAPIEEHTGKAYHLTGPEVLSGAQVAAALSEAVGGLVTYVPILEEDFRQQMASAPKWRVDSLLELYGTYRAGHAAQTTADVVHLTGHEPHTIQQFAHDYRHQFQTEE